MSAEQCPLSWIPEILEEIFLATDMRTLLTSSQRVCHQWHNIINNSNRIQVHLFFKPVTKRQFKFRTRKRNPLVNDKLWPEFHQQQLESPVVNQANQQAYLREEASWRRMLFQQPPTSTVGIFDLERERNRPFMSWVQFKPGNDYLRMGHVYKAVHRGTILPGEAKLMFWFDPGSPDRSQRDLDVERSIASSHYMERCDMVILTTVCWNLTESDIRDDLDDWINSLGSSKLDRRYWDLHMEESRNPFDRSTCQCGRLR